LRYLITGGAGFIGSHLADALTADGHEVLILDDLSTGRVENVSHLLAADGAELIEGSVLDERLVLDSAVGVKLVMERPVDTLLTNVRGNDVVISSCAAAGRPLLFVSTSEIYGKNSSPGLVETSDRLLGSPAKARWNYSTSKAFGEALALGYARELGAENKVVRLFNTVGPRQTGVYGMVVPRLVRQALMHAELTVYGNGQQSRCFAHVSDTVRALVALIETPEAIGRVFNIGSPAEIRIRDLAERVIKRTGSNSTIAHVPYEDAYEDGFEELGRRVPDTTALRELTGWVAEKTIDDVIDDVAVDQRAMLGAVADIDGGARLAG
jgi:UDP-glucose 4-epimerase